MMKEGPSKRAGCEARIMLEAFEGMVKAAGKMRPAKRKTPDDCAPGVEAFREGESLVRGWCLRSAGRTLGAAALGHELVELGLILCMAQPLEEFAEFLLLLFQAAQRFAAVFVEGMVAAAAATPAPTVAHPAPTLARLLPVLTRLALRLLPAPEAAMLPRSHSSAPYEEGQDGNTRRPIGHETQDHQGDPGRLAEIVHFGCDAHPGTMLML